MKILWFTNTPCGATEKLTGHKVIGGGWLFTLSEQLKQQPGYELHIAFFYKNYIESFVLDGIHYHPIYRETYKNKLQMVIGQFKSRFSNIYDSMSIDRAVRVANDVSPDIIHIHGSEDSYGLISKQLKNKKIVLSIQGLITPCREKLFSGIPQSEVLKYESFINALLFTGSRSINKQMKKNAIREQIILSNINNIVGRTKWDYDCSLAFNPQRNYYTVNEILRSEFLTHNWMQKINKSTLVISTTVSNGLFKGVESVYKTAKILKSSGYSFMWNLIGVSSTDSIVKIVEAYTETNADELCIQLLGLKNAQEMLDILDESDLFVQVSHIENSPNSLCEAMAIGMPIIATFAGGTSSMLADGNEGVLVQDGDSYSMAGAIIHAAQSYSQMIEMGQRAKERALTRHNPSNVCNELLQVYKQIL